VKQLLYILTFIFISVSVFGQTDSLLIDNNCANQLDTAEVIRIAKKENAWWKKKPNKLRGIIHNNRYRLYMYWYFNEPEIVFDEQNCEWRVYSSKQKGTKKGKEDVSDCHRYPYCTKTVSIVLKIDAKTKSIKSKEKKENYKKEPLAWITRKIKELKK
jgi:hypothetical protein